MPSLRTSQMRQFARASDVSSISLTATCHGWPDAFCAGGHRNICPKSHRV